ncbi:MAG: hypothetical protein IKB86_00580 [Clostridia bacterium]|nr:hypothetical protein [Clostridia bacterium]
MESIRSFIGTEVYCEGKIIGRITDFLIKISSKEISGLTCISNRGIIRGKFFVNKDGILHLDKNGAVVDKKSVKYKKSFNEEYAGSGFGVQKDNDFFSGSVGDIYFNPVTLEILSVSVKKGFVDDLLFGRDIVSVQDISMTEKGLIIAKNGY